MVLPRAVVVVVLEEEVLIEAVAREGHRRDAKAGEGVLEPVQSAETAGVAPCFAIIDLDVSLCTVQR